MPSDSTGLIVTKVLPEKRRHPYSRYNGKQSGVEKGRDGRKTAAVSVSKTGGAKNQLPFDRVEDPGSTMSMANLHSFSDGA